MAEWRAIPSFPFHEASSDGQVRRRADLEDLKDRPALLLRPRPDRDGYLFLMLRQERRGPRVRASLHSLVASAFLGARPDGLLIRHLDGDHLNNAAVNLAYGTASDNIYDQVRHGTHAKAAQTHCVNGHPFTAENTYLDRYRKPSGHRSCRACNREAARRYTARRQAVSS